MPDIKTKQDYAEYQKSVADFIAREKLSFMSTGTSFLDKESVGEEDGNNDSWFSWHPCECCGSHLGGMREYLFAWSGEEPNQTRVHFEICEDCVYYIEYGRLDDTTMERIEHSA